jgi:hypothetical protein
MNGDSHDLFPNTVINILTCYISNKMCVVILFFNIFQKTMPR